MSLPSTINRMKPQTLSVTRDHVTMVDGLATVTSQDVFPIVASVQPIDNTSLRYMPEGQSVQDSRVLWTETELRMRTDTTAPDIVTIGGQPYLVTAATYHGILSSFWRCFVEKVTTP